jgi:hypothetical protein
MALSAFCPTCQRTVYVQDGDTPACPVCSSPLLETVEPSEEDQLGGTKEPPPTARPCSNTIVVTEPV